MFPLSRRGMRDGEGIESFYTGEKYVGTYREDKQEGQVNKNKTR